MHIPSAHYSLSGSLVGLLETFTVHQSRRMKIPTHSRQAACLLGPRRLRWVMSLKANIHSTVNKQSPLLALFHDDNRGSQIEFQVVSDPITRAELSPCVWVPTCAFLVRLKAFFCCCCGFHRRGTANDFETKYRNQVGQIGENENIRDMHHLTFWA